MTRAVTLAEIADGAILKVDSTNSHSWYWNNKSPSTPSSWDWSFCIWK